MENLIFELCTNTGISGSELQISEFALKKFSNYSDVQIDKNNNVIVTFGNLDSKKHIMLDAHIDQIGMVVTYITKEGFLKIAPCGGVDCRVLPGSVLKIHGTKDILGIVTSVPPHLTDSDKNKKFKKVSDLYVDTGLTYDELKSIVKPSDTLSYYPKFKKLLNNNISCCSLDNRASVAALIKCAEILSKEKLSSKVSIVLSSQEETNSKGSKTAVYSLNPTESIVVDVSFASQLDVSEEKSGKLGCGPMIGIAPPLSKKISNKLVELSKKYNIPYQLEIMGSSTGTNADKISISKSGVPCGLLSIPQRYMHTPNELVNLDDIKNTAKLLSLYIKNGGMCND